MSDLISRTAPLAEYDKHHVGAPGMARKLIADAPTIDAVPVVRCKDCRFSVTISNDHGIFCEWWAYDRTLPDGFCHKGERKDDEH